MIIYTMPRKSKTNYSRRRLTPSGKSPWQPVLRGSRPTATAAPTPAPTMSFKQRAANLQGQLMPSYKRRYQKAKAQARYRANQRIEQSDNITTIPAFKLGKPREISFNEKVARINNPPQLFKRNYQWSAEAESGRKGWYGIPINRLDSSISANGGSLYDDIVVNAGRLTTDTNTVDPTVITGQVHNSQTKFYVDYLSEKLQMINSGTNSIKGKIKLWSYKRDCEFQFTNQSVPMTPINLMMYASAGALTANTTASEAAVGNGWNFNNSALGANYTANYDMPGSQLNSGGPTAQTDLALDVLSSHIKDFTGYFFKLENSVSFSLKPGQQIDHSIIFNDLPIIHRQSIDMMFIQGTSFYITVEFHGGIVGDSTATTGNNVISCGSAQISNILTEKRLIGLYQRIKTKVIMPTAPLAGIAKASQVIINPDTGAPDIGYDDDL